MGFLLLLPFFLIRFGLLSLLNEEAVKRAAYFAPLLDREKLAYWLYQLSNAGIVIYLFFLRIENSPTWLLIVSSLVYLMGLLLLIISMVNFAAPAENGINRNGLYRLSRNPMYVAYFVYFMGCVLLTQSITLFVLVLLFQITAHWIIISEERWCVKQFGEEYLQYMKQARRYI